MNIDQYMTEKNQKLPPWNTVTASKLNAVKKKATHTNMNGRIANVINTNSFFIMLLIYKIKEN